MYNYVYSIFSEHFGDALSNGVLNAAIGETFPDEIGDLNFKFLFGFEFLKFS